MFGSKTVTIALFLSFSLSLFFLLTSFSQNLCNLKLDELEFAKSVLCEVPYFNWMLF